MTCDMTFYGMFRAMFANGANTCHLFRLCGFSSQSSIESRRGTLQEQRLAMVLL